MNESTVLPYSVIFMAVQGDIQAMEQVVEHYRKYIVTLAQREVVDEHGNTALVVDNEWRKRLELKLITAVVKFQLY